MKLTEENQDIGHTEAKNLATEGAAKALYDEPNLEINPNFNLTRAQLTNMTQALTYKGICKTKATHHTTQMLAITRHATQETSRFYPDSNEVWKATQHKDFNKPF
jgi:hypothetical protein